MRQPPSRRDIVHAALGLAATSLLAWPADAQTSVLPFPDWVGNFRARALASGISSATYARVMEPLKPDNSVFSASRNQPEFSEALWKYLNRRVSAWRIKTGKERLREHASLLRRIELQFGVDAYALLGLWGQETAFGEIVADPRYVRRVIPALATLAWGEPRRRTYWERELLNALLIIERGWSTEAEMVGSWAGAMGHTQWMPEVWLNIGIDYDRDGRVSPFGPPDDALASSARYLADRGKWQRGQIWGCEVSLPAGFNAAQAGTTRPFGFWHARGLTRLNGQPFPNETTGAQLWTPVQAGPSFLLTRNFFAIYAYNPSRNYALALLHLGDRIRGEDALARSFPGAERALTLAEVQEMQGLLIKAGFDTGPHTDGRTARELLAAIRSYQHKAGLVPADGYPGLRVLAHLRQGS